MLINLRSQLDQHPVVSFYSICLQDIKARTAWSATFHCSRGKHNQHLGFRNSRSTATFHHKPPQESWINLRPLGCSTEDQNSRGHLQFATQRTVDICKKQGTRKSLQGWAAQQRAGEEQRAGEDTCCASCKSQVLGWSREDEER
mmetsp:Transcript_8889/g.14443  ORF Transcript_8889/g.14443 Transcript_8889/m.14443 type:complete len:144 (+) Transcript_8889:2665-3096(+)